MADGGRDYDPVNISEADLRNVVFPPFKAAVDAGVGTIMSAYMDLNNTPASANAHTLREILRDEWGFDGFVVSDASAIRNLVTEGYAKDDKDAAGKAFKAGVNMDMSSFSYIRFLGELIREGSVTMEELDNAVRPILEIGAKELTYWCSSANTYVQDETTIDLWTGSNLDAKLHTVFEVRGKSTRGIVEQ